MVKILQISDLHIVNDVDGNNFKTLLLSTAGEEFSTLPQGNKLLIIAGDFHFYNETDYQKSINLIKELSERMRLDLASDVFLIPGNHDLSSPSNKMEAKQQVCVVNAVKHQISLLQDEDYINLLLKRFEKYSKFCNELGVYSDINLPATVHLRTWRNKLNIIHLNTCLVADGKEKNNQLLDTKSLSTLKITNSLPSLVVGHNSFFDLEEKDIQNKISFNFINLNVKAYLCGDKHKTENNRYQQTIKLSTGFSDTFTIPNIVCCRTSADIDDTFSDFGCIIHTWDEDSGFVELNVLKWDSVNDQSKFNQECFPNAYNLKRESSSIPSPMSSLDIYQSVLNNYHNYIRMHCSEIELNGLPTNSEDITRKYELSKLFVPLRFIEKKQQPIEVIKQKENNSQSIELSEELDKLFNEFMAMNHGITSSITISDLIPKDKRFLLLILADPGAGKTTLLKHVASAYCFPDEYLHDSGLTERSLFPIWIRCRDITDNDYSIWKEINSIPLKGEWAQDEKCVDSFASLVHYHINNGTAVLLIDGLDEIGSDSGRKGFVEHLCSFIQNNPKVNVIVTSREKGFSIVTDNMFKDFKSLSIADLTHFEIEQLCTNWFSLVYGNSEDVRKDKEKLVNRIIQDKRIERLAKNPLLLTTLLLVDRRTGSLPTKRAGLYYEATRVLLETWNPDVHDRGIIDLDEAKNQLAFVAYHMTTHYEKYKNKINKPDLIALLRKVRSEHSNLVSGNIGSIDDVINVIQRRSALLIQTGMELMNDGHTEPVYEFMHTTFQEYLAAYAVSLNCYPGAISKKEKGTDLLPYIFVENMKEVILLSAAMDSACADNLTKMIQEKLQSAKSSFEIEKLGNILLNFVADEASLSRDVIHSIFVSCTNHGIYFSFVSTLKRICAGKYRQNLDNFLKETDAQYNNGFDNHYSLVSLLSNDISNPYEYYIKYYKSSDIKQKAKAYSVLTNAFFLDRNLSGLKGDKRLYIKSNAINDLSHRNQFIAKAAFRLMRMGNFIDTIDDLGIYINALSCYINMYNDVPCVIGVNEIRGIKQFKLCHINVSMKLSDIVVELICKDINDDFPLSLDDYCEKLMLILVASVCCDENATYSKLYSNLRKYLPNDHIELHMLKEHAKTLNNLIKSCPFTSKAAKEAIREYMKIFSGIDQSPLQINELLNRRKEQEWFDLSKFN